MRQTRSLLVLLLLPGALAAQGQRLRVEVEGGPVWQSYNDVEIPNDGSATRFSLERLAGRGPWPAGRLYLTWRLAERHGLRLLIAPLEIEETGAPARALRFAGVPYEAGVPTDATYVFDSYRLSWRYHAHRGERTDAWVGLTGKVRDARIQLRQGDRTSRKDDLGFVPLLHLAGSWRFAPAWAVTADLDGLAGGPGRALDAVIRAERRLGERASVGVGYRTVEGGADVPDVYTFAWLHYAVLSFGWSP